MTVKIGKKKPAKKKTAKKGKGVPSKAESTALQKAKLSPPKEAIDFAKGTPSKQKRIDAAVAKLNAMDDAGEIDKDSFEALPIEVRRLRMWELKQKGYPVSVIIEMFGVCRATFNRDMSIVNDELAYELNKTGPLGVVAKAYSFFDHLRDQVMFAYESLDPDAVLKDKLDLIRLAKDIEDSKSKMLLSVGAVPMGRKGRVAQEMMVEDGDEFTPEDARKVMAKMIELQQSREGVHE